MNDRLSTLVCALLLSTWTTIVVAWHWSRHRLDPMETSLVQDTRVIVCVFGVALLAIWAAYRPRHLGAFLPPAVSLAIVTDALVKSWSGHHLISAFILELSGEKASRLTPFASWSMFWPLASLWCPIIAGYILIHRLAKRWNLPNVSLPSDRVWKLELLTLIAAATMCVPQLSHHLKPPLASKDAEETTHIELDLQESSDQRLRMLRMNVIDSSQLPTERLPDVVVIVMESLRPELIDPTIMPNTHSLANQGVWLQNHWSGGNGTSLGMFSLVSGMEARWFYKSDARHAPTLNRLLRQAGYELGFFAGHNDWQAFQMDAFVSPNHYDRFESSPMDWLNSDRRAIKLARQFVDSSNQRPPRLAFVYLYSTHAPFDVDPANALDVPYATKDYPIPYPSKRRTEVWNRYRNAARTLDEAIRPLLTTNRVVLVTGDHGESFLEDGSVGHGTQMSRVQLQTPAIIAGAATDPKSFTEITSHADLLPTLLGILGLRCSQPELLNGLDLLAAKPDQLARRVISVADYVQHRLLLLPSNHMLGGDQEIPRNPNVQFTNWGVLFDYSYENSRLSNPTPHALDEKTADAQPPSLIRHVTNAWAMDQN